MALRALHREKSETAQDGDGGMENTEMAKSFTAIVNENKKTAKSFEMYAVPFMHASTIKALDVETAGAYALFYHKSNAEDLIDRFPPLDNDSPVKVRVTIERAGKRKAKP